MSVHCIQLNNIKKKKKKKCRSKTQALVDCKATLLSKTEILDNKKSLLEETNAEKQKLQRERKMLREMLQNITQDLNSVK